MRVLMAVAIAAMFVNPAQAQDVLLEVTGAAGYANALHGDLRFGAPAVSATARVRVSPHVALEAQVGYWQHTERSRFIVQPGEPVDISSRFRYPSTTFSVVAVSSRDARIGPYGGAGVGLFYQMRRFHQSATTLFPSHQRSEFDVSLGGGFVGGVDVRVGKKLKTFGEVRFDVQSFRDPGSSSVRVVGGVRVAVGS